MTAHPEPLAYMTGYDGSAHPARARPAEPRPVGLTDVQQRGFRQIFTTLLAMPDDLTLHTQACRISASWAHA